MTARILSFSALTMHSSDPERLARFYRDTLSLPLEPHKHGTLGLHHEGDLGTIHFAVWKASERVGGPFVPVFRVADLDAAAAAVARDGVSARHKPLDLGEGKRVISFDDPDGNAFRLIELRDA
jgi:predicted enzyme related to lactoylglutathione lyase